MAEAIKASEYNHPNFTIKRETHLNAVQSPSVSLTDFAHFRCRNKCIVTHVSITCTSLPSAITTWTLLVMRDGTSTAVVKTLTGFTSVINLSAVVLTVASKGTMATIGNNMAIRFDSTEKGKFDVIYEYRFLP